MSQPDRNLYSAGWRQGSVFRAALQVRVTTSEGSFDFDHDFWVVCTQDCDLFGTAQNSTELIEVRPILPWPQKLALTIRSRRFPIQDGFCVDWRSPKAAVPANFVASLTPQGSPEVRRRRYFKTWLGRGYDRPAVPEAQVEIAFFVAKAVNKLSKPEVNAYIRDVLMVFRADEAKYVELYAVVLEEHGDQRDNVSLWLNDLAIMISEAGYTVGPREARLESETSLQLVESSYAADLSDITRKTEERSDSRGPTFTDS